MKAKQIFNEGDHIRHIPSGKEYDVTYITGTTDGRILYQYDYDN